MYTEEQIARYNAELDAIQSDSELFSLLERHKGEADHGALLESICDTFLDVIQREFYQYTEDILKDHPDIKTFLKLAEYIEGGELTYYQAVAAFFRGEHTRTVELLKKAVPQMFEADKDSVFGDKELALAFIAPFKGAFPGFWDEVYHMLSAYPVAKGVLELCKAVPIVYSATEYDEVRAALEGGLALNPDSGAAKELLAHNCFQEKLWGNAVALLEQIEDPSILFPEDTYFMMGWCYGKLKETANEIEAYENCAKIDPARSFVMNNLGYAYYQAKQFGKALEAFRRCIDNNWDTRLAANNYVRTLLAMKRYRDAKAFVKNPPARISKALLDRVRNAENTNKRIAADKPFAIPEDADEGSVGEQIMDIGEKKQQFSSERILEDELVLRMEAGLEVFGKRLKIYRRKGVYGRQYILSNGKRPDLLAEDTEGNLYVIELKKDSGYDDAYAQIVEYLEWFDKNWSGKVKGIYGVICLNDPSQELLDKVHKNERVRIFEYRISYTER